MRSISKGASGPNAAEARIPESWHVPGLPKNPDNRTLAYVPERARTSVIDGPSIRVIGTTGSNAPESAGRAPLPVKAPALRVENDSDDIIADLMEGAATARRKELLAALRNMSLSVAGMLNDGKDPGLQAAIVKDVGCSFEQGLPELAQELVDLEPTLANHGIDYQQVLGNLVQLAPSFSLRGGTPEILRGIIARGLGLR